MCSFFESIVIHTVNYSSFYSVSVSVECLVAEPQSRDSGWEISRFGIPVLPSVNTDSTLGDCLWGHDCLLWGQRGLLKDYWDHKVEPCLLWLSRWCHYYCLSDTLGSRPCTVLPLLVGHLTSPLWGSVSSPWLYRMDFEEAVNFVYKMLTM